MSFLAPTSSTRAFTSLETMIQFLRRPSTRLLAAAVTILTTRHLITDGFHYPMLLLLSHVTIAFGLRIVAPTSSWQQEDCFEPWTGQESRLHLIVRSLLVASSLVFGYQSFLHLGNTVFWIMVISLNWGAVFSSWTSTGCTDAVKNIIRGMTLAICGAMLVLQEHRLTDVGIRLLLIAVICSVAAFQCRGPNAGRTLGLDNHNIVLAASIPATIIAFFVVEVWDAGDLHVKGRIPWLVINAIFGAIMLGRTASIEQAQESFEGENQHLFDKTGARWVVSSIFLALVAGLDNAIALSRPTTTTSSQVCAFLLASAATINFHELIGALPDRPGQNDPDHEEQTQDPKSPLMPRGRHQTIDDFHALDSTASWRQRIAVLLQCLIHGLTWLLVAHFAFSLRTLKIAPALAPDSNTTSDFDFDIVIARYHEPLREVAASMNSILSSPNLHNLRTRVILYNKGEDDLNATNMRESFYPADEVLVCPLENVGREAETYLSHLLNHDREDLASHTLFIQAEPHDTAWMQTRLRQYFVRDTGFLSLSNTGRFCGDCDQCGDSSGWLVDPATMHHLFEQSNPDRGECADISLTYRGQFVVSRQRIRKLERQALLDVREKTLESKRFGYTMERLWGVLFGCSSISSRCPSLLSGHLGNLAPGGAGDCQCLD